MITSRVPIPADRVESALSVRRSGARDAHTPAREASNPPCLSECLAFSPRRRRACALPLRTRRERASCSSRSTRVRSVAARSRDRSTGSTPPGVPSSCGARRCPLRRVRRPRYPRDRRKSLLGLRRRPARVQGEALHGPAAAHVRSPRRLRAAGSTSLLRTSRRPSAPPPLTA